MRKVVTLLVGYDDGTIAAHFGIRHEGHLWLVTRWLISHATQEATPERMIRVEEYQKSGSSKFDFENILLPRDVIEGKTEDAEGYVVKSLPDSPVVHRRDLYMLPSIFPESE